MFVNDLLLTICVWDDLLLTIDIRLGVSEPHSQAEPDLFFKIGRALILPEQFLLITFVSRFLCVKIHLLAFIFDA